MVVSLNSESKLHQEENVYLRFCNWNNQLCTLLSETNLIKGKQNKKEKDDKYKFSFPFCNLKYFTILNSCVNTRTEYIKIRTDNKLLWNMIVIIFKMFCFDSFIKKRIEIDIRSIQLEGILLSPIFRQFKCYFINRDVSVKTFIFALPMPWGTLIVIVTHKHKIKLISNVCFFTY